MLARMHAAAEEEEAQAPLRAAAAAGAQTGVPDRDEDECAQQMVEPRVPGSFIEPCSALRYRFGMLALVAASAVGVILAAVWTVSLQMRSAAEHVSAALTVDSRPHIILIEADQVRSDAHMLGNGDVSFSFTPHLNRLAAEGVAFLRAYSSTPICTPARLALLTGRSSWRHGMRSYQSQVPQPDGSRLELVSTLAAAGYHTAVVGKNHYGTRSNRTDPGKVGNGGNRSSRGEAVAFASHGYAESHLYEGLLANDRRSPHFKLVDDYGAFFERECPTCDPLAAGDGARPAASAWRAEATASPYRSWGGYTFPYTERLHPTRWAADTAITVIDRWLGVRRLASEPPPLFLKLSFHRPHPPYDPPDRWLRRVLRASAPIEPGVHTRIETRASVADGSPADATDAGAASSNADGGAGGTARLHMSAPVVGDWEAEFHAEHECNAANGSYCGLRCGLQADCGRLPLSEARAMRAHYCASLGFVDEQAGRVLARLERSPSVWNVTWVMYTSDHGDELGDHDLLGKGHPYESSTAVPLFLRWPSSWHPRSGVQRGAQLRHLVELRDVFPTLAAIAGVQLPSAAEDGSAPDGRSLLDLLSAGSTSAAAASWRRILLLELAMCGFAGLNWVALTDGEIKYVRHLNNGREQLFDLILDPRETRDLSRENASATGAWGARLADVFAKEGRGEMWVSDGVVQNASDCENYTLTDNYRNGSPGG